MLRPDTQDSAVLASRYHASYWRHSKAVSPTLMRAFSHRTRAYFGSTNCRARTNAIQQHGLKSMQRTRIIGCGSKNRINLNLTTRLLNARTGMMRPNWRTRQLNHNCTMKLSAQSRLLAKPKLAMTPIKRRLNA